MKCEGSPGSYFRLKWVKETRQLTATCDFVFSFAIKDVIGTIDGNGIMPVIVLYQCEFLGFDNFPSFNQKGCYTTFPGVFLLLEPQGSLG